MSAIERFAGVRVLCVGDVMLDRFVSGEVKRISPESPIPILLVKHAIATAGGAGNVARNVAALGGTVTLIGVVGSDEASKELGAAIDRSKGILNGLIKARARRTTQKTRYVAQGQHMLRADIEDAEPLEREIVDQLCEAILSQAPSHDVIVLSDYAKGVLTDPVISAAMNVAKLHELPVVVDPKSARLDRYRGATVITPNARETWEATGIEASEDDDLSIAAGRAILVDAAVDAVLITRAQHGMSLVPRSGDAAHLAASAREVYDVVGAGDTVVATLALALGAQQPLLDAARLANTAAGLVVGKHGAATVSASELTDEVLRLGGGSVDTLGSKIHDLPGILEKVAEWRREGRKVGFTNGCFDLLHVGHLSLLSFARAKCDRLIVGLNSDASVRRLKGPTRPITGESDRAIVLAALSAIDAVVVFDHDTPVDLIRDIKPDILVKGADYTIEQIVGADLVLAYGGQVLTCDLVPGRSTTKLADTIRKGENE